MILDAVFFSWIGFTILVTVVIGGDDGDKIAEPTHTINKIVHIEKGGGVTVNAQCM